MINDESQYNHESLSDIPPPDLMDDSLPPAPSGSAARALASDSMRGSETYEIARRLKMAESVEEQIIFGLELMAEFDVRIRNQHAEMERIVASLSKENAEAKSVVNAMADMEKAIQVYATKVITSRANEIQDAIVSGAFKNLETATRAITQHLEETIKENSASVAAAYQLQSGAMGKLLDAKFDALAGDLRRAMESAQAARPSPASQARAAKAADDEQSAWHHLGIVARKFGSWLAGLFVER